MTTVDEFVANSDGNQFPIARAEIILGAGARCGDIGGQGFNLNWPTFFGRAAIRQE